jgi:hypothetical protein
MVFANARLLVRPAAVAVVQTQEEVSVKETGVTQMLFRTIDVDGLRAFCREGGTSALGTSASGSTLL